MEPQDSRVNGDLQLDELARLAPDLVAIGICGTEPFADVREELHRRKASGESGLLTFTYNRPDTSTDVRSSFPWAKRLVVGATSYLPEAGSPGESVAGSARIARFSAHDHYDGLRTGLGNIADYLRSASYQAEVLVDDNRLVDRAAAVRAGIGWWGKNTMVLTPRFGPWILLGSVVTDAELPESKPMERTCGTCAACIPACPTGAIVAPGVLDARLCLAAILQAPGPIPIELRESVGDRLYGCDDCLDACPPGERLLASSSDVRGRVAAEDILRASDEDLLDDFDRFYIPRRNPNYLRRNALVVIGNNPASESRDLVSQFVADPDPMVAEHAQWALERIDA